MTKDKNKPKRGLSAFMVFSKERRGELKVSDPTMEFAVIAKRCGADWKLKTDKQKQKYLKASNIDKARYEKEMMSYVPPHGAQKKKKRPKDPNAPKRSKSAYMLWLQVSRPAFVKANPKCIFGEVGAALGKEWNSVKGSAACKKYYAAADKEKLRYEKETKAYYAGLGNC